MNTRDRITSAAAALFDTRGYESTSVAAVCQEAGVSNGSFFHAFETKEALGAELFMSALESYHGAMLNAVAAGPDAWDGVACLVNAHLNWVVKDRTSARFLFEQSRSEWIVHMRDRQAKENQDFAQCLDVWRLPHVAAGQLVDLPRGVFLAQLIGPAQIFCRAWLSGRVAADPRDESEVLVDCARRAILTPAGAQSTHDHP